MKSAVRRRALVALPVLALGLAGCSMHEQTQGWYDATDGVSVDAGDIGIRDVVVVADDEGRSTVLATFANAGGADELVEVVVGDVSAEPSDGPLEIPRDGYAKLGPEGPRVDVTEAGTVPGGTIEVEFRFADAGTVPGSTIEVEFRFADAPRASVEALVQPHDGIYEGVLPLDAPNPTFTAVPDSTATPASTTTPGTATPGTTGTPATTENPAATETPAP